MAINVSTTALPLMMVRSRVIAFPRRQPEQEAHLGVPCPRGDCLSFPRPEATEADVPHSVHEMVPRIELSYFVKELLQQLSSVWGANNFRGHVQRVELRLRRGLWFLDCVFC